MSSDFLSQKSSQIFPFEFGPTRVDNLRVIGPEELRRMWKSNSDDERRPKLNFDAVVSFSSIEHSGLGRYGDALNPWGDLIASAQAW